MSAWKLRRWLTVSAHWIVRKLSLPTLLFSLLPPPLCLPLLPIFDQTLALYLEQRIAQLLYFMAPFQIQRQYSDVDDNSEKDLGSDDESDFKIKSDVSNTELQELRQELKKLESKKVQRELADATLALQKMYMEKWERYDSILLWISLLKSLMVKSWL